MATYNWLITCGCGSPIEYNCNTCGEKLCANCKEAHLQNSNNKHHSTTEYAKKLMPGNLSSPSCHDHNGEECICWCQTCGKAACIDCVTTSHQGHEFTKLEIILQEKRAGLQKDLKNLECVLKEWQDLMTEAGEVTSYFLSRVNRIEKELDKRAKEFHQRVDETLEKYKTQLNELKTSNLAFLHEQEKTVSDGLEKVKQEIKECEVRLRSNNIESLLAHEGTEDGKKDVLPKLSCAIPPVLFPSQLDAKALTEMFGQLTVLSINQQAEGDSQPSVDTSHNTQKSFPTGEAKIPIRSQTKQSTATGHNKTVQASPRDTQTPGATAPTKPLQLIPKPSVQSEFGTKTRSPSVTCIGSG